MLLFDADTPELSIDAISERTATARSTTYRLIQTLCKKGLIEKTAPGVYRPGIHLLNLAGLAIQQNHLARLALPTMQSLAAQTQETVLLVRHFGAHAVCIERVETQQNIRITFQIGHPQPLHAGASSKILLAYLPEAERERVLAAPLQAFTSHTITDPDTLRRQLRDIRAAGYCVTQSEVDDGATAISVPILDSKNHIMAALSTAGPSFRLDDSRISQHITLLKAAAHTIQEQSHKLGYTTFAS